MEQCNRFLHPCMAARIQNWSLAPSYGVATPGLQPMHLEFFAQAKEILCIIAAATVTV